MLSDGSQMANDEYQLPTASKEFIFNSKNRHSASDNFSLLFHDEE
jgi:hypothetical protein